MKGRFSIIIAIILSVVVYPQKDIRIVSSDFNSLIFEYYPSFTSLSTIKVENKEYRQILLADGIMVNSGTPGSPQNYKRIIPVGVPSETGNTIQVLASEFNEIDGKLPPIVKIVNDGFTEIRKYEEGESYYYSDQNEDIVKFGTFAVSRGLPTQLIEINPIHFYPLENKIRLYSRVVIKINFTSGNLNSLNGYDEFHNGTVINFEVAKSWVKQNRKLEKTETTNSVLANGKWVRFEAPEEGIYKITKQMLNSIGIDSNVDPRTIKIYNNSGKALPEKIYDPRPVDLVENAIFVLGEDDGVFNDQDYILFYGRGTNFWDYNPISSKIERAKHHFSTENYYWITFGGALGKRIVSKVAITDPNPLIKTTSKAFEFLDEDKINVGKSGRIFVGDDFSSSMKNRTYTKLLEGFIQGSQINYSYRVVNASIGNIPFKIEESGNKIVDRTLPGTGAGSYMYTYPVEGSATYTGNLNESRSLLKFIFDAQQSSAYGYIDYYELQYLRELKTLSDQMIFFSDKEGTVVEYQLSNFSSSDIYVFDITNYYNVEMISCAISGGNCKFQANEPSNSISKYLAVTSAKFKTPINFNGMKNQNLRGISPGAKHVIITNKNFIEQAERLSQYRSTQAKSPLSSIVINVEEIFNEFSGGLRDVSGVRDFIKYAYDNWQIRPEYILMFGDGDYDYRNIEGNNKNFVITYQTLNSHSELYSYCMDDFFASVDGNDLSIDIAIGRINIQSISDAVNSVNKIIDYETGKNLGNWRNLITFVADDQLTSTGYDGAPNNIQSEELSAQVPQSFDQHKIYLATYPTVQTSLGRRKPAVNQAIIDAINNGSLIMNFYGHGSPDLWTHEQVFVKSVTIPQLVNNDLIFISAATCDFGYYDNPNLQSAAEELLLKANSGAIGLFTSVRPVFSHQNHALTKAFYQKLLASPLDSSNLPVSIGTAYQKTKVSYYSENDLKFNLFGDPAIRLSIPRYTASIDTINNFAVTSNIQLKALGKVNIKGIVRKPDGNKWNGFNGEGVITIFDSERTLPVPEVYQGFEMVIQGGIIFRGRISIVNGEFSTGFVVPKDISYENKNGKVVFYFYDLNNDGVGFTNKVIVGGTDTTVINDGNGPQIEIYFDDLNNVSGYLVNPNSTLIVDLNDETGLNTTGVGVGHKLEGIMNDDEAFPIDFSNFFTGDLDSGGKSGKVKYKFSNLEQGEHKITVKAWDVFNNLAEQSAYFKVVDENKLVIDNVMNFPNPFSSNTVFTFQHNINKPINVRIRIFTIAGRLIQEIENLGVSFDRFVKIDWDGRDRDGNHLANGTYLYKLIVESFDGEFKESVLGKLAIIR